MGMVSKLMGGMGSHPWRNGTYCVEFFCIDSTSHSNSDTLRPFILQTVCIVLLVIGICYMTGEKPMWQWGEKQKSDSQK